MDQRRRSLAFLSLLGFLPCLVAFVQLTDWQARFSIAASAAVSACGFWMTCALIPTVARLTLRRGLFGASACFSFSVCAHEMPDP